MSFSPCWVHVDPERVNTHAAPAPPLSPDPPISAVLPSAESATLLPNSPSPVSPVPVSFSPCWVQVDPERVNTHAAPTPAGLNVPPLSAGPPISAVLPSAESATLVPEFAFPDVVEHGLSGVARAVELSALLGPRGPRAREHPRPAGFSCCSEWRSARLSAQCCHLPTAPHCSRTVRLPISSRAGQLFALLDQRVDPQRIVSTPIPHAHQQLGALQL